MDWNRLVTELGPRLFRYFSASFSEALASDLVQETLVRLVRRCHQGAYDPAKGSPTMLAFGIAHFVRLEAIKATARAPRLEPLGETHAEAVESPKWEGESPARRLRRALGQLKEVERQIVILHIDEEMRLAEIATILRLPLGTVKSHLHRAKEKLREVISREEDR